MAETAADQKRSLIKMLFQKLTETILDDLKTKEMALDMLVTIGKWAGTMTGAILWLLEKDQQKLDSLADRFGRDMTIEVKAHTRLMRTVVTQIKPEKKIITEP